MDTPSTTKAVSTHWTAVFVIVGSGIAAALQVGKAAIAAPLLQNDFGIGLTAIGWLTGIFALIGLVGGIPTGAFVARFGARRILIIGLLVTTAGAALGAAVPGLPSLFCGRIIEGAGFLLVTVAAPSLLQEVTRPADRDLAFALWSCFMPVGMAVAMLVGPFFEDWQRMWWASGALALAICIAVPLVISAGGQGQIMSWNGLRRDSMTVARDRSAVGLAITIALYSMMFFAVFSFLPVLLMERLQVTHQTAGLLSALASAVNVIGNLTAGLLLSRGFSRPALLIAACLVMGLASFGIFLPVLPDGAAFGLCLLFSTVGGVIPAILLSSAPLVAPAAGLVPVVLGLIIQGSNLGQILGPTAIGGALDRFGWDSAAYIVAGTAVIAVLVVASTLRRVGAQRGKLRDGRALMRIEFNHTILATQDAHGSALFLAEMLGLQPPRRWGPFWMVTTDNGVNLDYMDVGHAVVPQHYAFLVDDTSFDALHDRLDKRSLPYWADPQRRKPGMNNHDGGHGLYFNDLNGHLLEVITRPYGSGGWNP